jgi:hypothetical protein
MRRFIMSEIKTKPTNLDILISTSVADMKRIYHV